MIAKKTGQDFKVLMNAAKDLAADGMMTVGEAAMAMRNLLLKGAKTEEIIVFLKRLKEQAVFNRQAHYELGEAVVATTEGIRNDLSIQADAAGITRNLANMYAEYAKQMGISRLEMTESEKWQAAYIGFMKDSEASVGSLAIAYGTLSGQAMRFKGNMITALQDLGAQLEPIAVKIYETLGDAFEFVGTDRSFREAITAIGESLMAAFSLAIPVVKALGPPILDIIAMLGKATAAVLTLVAAVVQFIDKLGALKPILIAVGVAWALSFAQGATAAAVAVVNLHATALAAAKLTKVASELKAAQLAIAETSIITKFWAVLGKNITLTGMTMKSFTAGFGEALTFIRTGITALFTTFTGIAILIASALLILNEIAKAQDSADLKAIGKMTEDVKVATATLRSLGKTLKEHAYILASYKYPDLVKQFEGAKEAVVQIDSITAQMKALLVEYEQGRIGVAEYTRELAILQKTMNDVGMSKEEALRTVAGIDAKLGLSKISLREFSDFYIGRVKEMEVETDNWKSKLLRLIEYIAVAFGSGGLNPSLIGTVAVWTASGGKEFDIAAQEAEDQRRRLAQKEAFQTNMINQTAYFYLQLDSLLVKYANGKRKTEEQIAKDQEDATLLIKHPSFDLKKYNEYLVRHRDAGLTRTNITSEWDAIERDFTEKSALVEKIRTEAMTAARNAELAASAAAIKAVGTAAATQTKTISEMFTSTKEKWVDFRKAVASAEKGAGPGGEIEKYLESYAKAQGIDEGDLSAFLKKREEMAKAAADAVKEEAKRVETLNDVYGKLKGQIGDLGKKYSEASDSMQKFSINQKQAADARVAALVDKMEKESVGREREAFDIARDLARQKEDLLETSEMTVTEIALRENKRRVEDNQLSLERQIEDIGAYIAEVSAEWARYYDMQKAEVIQKSEESIDEWWGKIAERNEDIKKSMQEQRDIVIATMSLEKRDAALKVINAKELALLTALGTEGLTGQLILWDRTDEALKRVAESRDLEGKKVDEQNAKYRSQQALLEDLLAFSGVDKEITDIGIRAERFIDVFNGGISSLGDNFKSFGELALGIIGELWMGIEMMFSTLISDLLNGTKTLGEALANFGKGLLGQLADLGMGAFKKHLTSGVTAAMTAATAAGGSALWAGITSVFSSLATYAPYIAAIALMAWGIGKALYDAFRQPTIWERIESELAAKIGGVFSVFNDLKLNEKALGIIAAYFGLDPSTKEGRSALENKIPIGLYIPAVQMEYFKAELKMFLDHVSKEISLGITPSENTLDAVNEMIKRYGDRLKDGLSVLVNELGMTLSQAALEMQPMLQELMNVQSKWNGGIISADLAAWASWAAKLGVAFDTVGMKVLDARNKLVDLGKWLIMQAAPEKIGKTIADNLKNLMTAIDSISKGSSFAIMAKNMQQAFAEVFNLIKKDILELRKALEGMGYSITEITAKIKEVVSGTGLTEALLVAAKYSMQALETYYTLGKGTTETWAALGAGLKAQIELMRQLGMTEFPIFKKLLKDYQELKRNAAIIKGVMTGVVGYFTELGNQGKINSKNFAESINMAMFYIEAMKKAGATAAEVWQATQSMYETFKTAQLKILDDFYTRMGRSKSAIDASGKSIGGFGFTFTDVQKKAIEDFMKGVEGAEAALIKLKLPPEIFNEIVRLKEVLGGPLWATFEKFYKQQEKLQKAAALLGQINLLMQGLGKKAFGAKGTDTDAAHWEERIKALVNQMRNAGMTMKDIVGQYGDTFVQLYNQYIKEGKTVPAWLQRYYNEYEKQKKQQEQQAKNEAIAQLGMLEAFKAIILALTGTVPAALQAAINAQQNVVNQLNQSAADFKNLGKAPGGIGGARPGISDPIKDAIAAQDDLTLAVDNTNTSITKTTKVQGAFTLAVKDAKTAVTDTTKEGGKFRTLMLAWLKEIIGKVVELEEAFKGSGVYTAIQKTGVIATIFSKNLDRGLKSNQTEVKKLERAFKGSGVYSAISSVRDLGDEFEDDLIRNLTNVTDAVGELETAWSYFGISTKVELEAVAAKSLAYFYDIKNSGLATTDGLKTAWQATADAIIASGGTLSAEFLAIGQAMGLGLSSGLGEAMDTALGLFGVKTKAELEKIAADSITSWNTVYASGLLTPDELYKAWVITSDAIKASGGTLSAEFAAIGARLKLQVEDPVTSTAEGFKNLGVVSSKAFELMGKNADKLREKIEKITNAASALVEAISSGIDMGTITPGNAAAYAASAQRSVSLMAKTGTDFGSILDTVRGFQAEFETILPGVLNPFTQLLETLSGISLEMNQLGSYQTIFENLQGAVPQADFSLYQNDLVNLFSRIRGPLDSAFPGQNMAIRFMQGVLGVIHKNEDVYKKWYSTPFKALMKTVGFAEGLWEVPRDNFVANLHKGEMVVPAAASANLRSEYNNSNVIKFPQPQKQNVDQPQHPVTVQPIVIPITIGQNKISNVVLEVVARGLKNGSLDIGVRNISSAS
ncbi:MAG: hypothetical protein NTW48_09165 [Chloroflexi bacterium]|nr:hypothetical protein [Chloroflexota bacterium]